MHRPFSVDNIMNMIYICIYERVNNYPEKGT